jgi:hypothetical protein
VGGGGWSAVPTEPAAKCGKLLCHDNWNVPGAVGGGARL